MIIETKFEIGDKVVINELNIAGKVVAFYYDIQLEYKVRYFDSGDLNHIFFLEDELEVVK